MNNNINEQSCACYYIVVKFSSASPVWIYWSVHTYKLIDPQSCGLFWNTQSFGLSLYTFQVNVYVYLHCKQSGVTFGAILTLEISLVFLHNCFYKDSLHVNHSVCFQSEYLPASFQKNNFCGMLKKGKLQLKYPRQWEDGGFRDNCGNISYRAT